MTSRSGRSSQWHGAPWVGSGLWPWPCRLTIVASVRRLRVPASRDGHLLQGDLTLLQGLKERIAVTETMIKNLAAGDEVVDWLASLPGIGTFLA